MSELETKVLQFMERFNAGDLDAAMADFAENSQYIDEYGTIHSGKKDISEALAPIFNGAFGQLKYTVSDLILDSDANRALVTWELLITGADSAVSRMQGLDILDFEGTRVRSKNCFIKAKETLIEPLS